ncbi:flagellar hook-length control protein FliK [Thiohalobacter sp. IOR34]|uniref:flagellar hook-length control protein FliK n=1 Tax=Thiohalobacter sp. IOR34 TaxID=3057176 RepID=UPI0025B05DE9|nr:flagellar hook-length control protein FliK [Thiohalobacter sp. IOR34]WJW74570.1 flagellar hook-length control protein FliK [Thiohalobacter sp. IOR34]
MPDMMLPQTPPQSVPASSAQSRPDAAAEALPGEVAEGTATPAKDSFSQVLDGQLREEPSNAAEGTTLPEDGKDLPEVLEAGEQRLLELAEAAQAETETLPVDGLPPGVPSLPLAVNETLADAEKTGRQAAARQSRAARPADGLLPLAAQAAEAADSRPLASAEHLPRPPLDVLQQRLQEVLHASRGTPQEGLRQTPLPADRPQTPDLLAVALPSAQPAAPAPTASAPLQSPPSATLAVPLQQPGWDEALGERVLWMTGQKLQAAEIKLNPPQLGPIEVRIQMHQDQAQVSFTAHHAVVRDALEAAIPRLREMLGDSGLQLLDVNISEHSFAEQRQAAGDTDGESSAGWAGEAAEEVDSAQETLLPRHAGAAGRVDLFA